MERPNIIIIIIDTLREDYSAGLERLKKIGFVRYKNTIAPAPWTLPSHVSMVTGLYPSRHGIHETMETFLGGERVLMNLAMRGMNKLNKGIIGELEQEGYRTYIITANAFLTPAFGFKSNINILIEGKYCLTNLRTQRLKSEFHEFKKCSGNYGKYALTLLKQGRLLDLLYGLYYLAAIRRIKLEIIVRKILGMEISPEKGSNNVLKILKKPRKYELELDTPFSLLINIMEAHSPYTIKDLYSKSIISAYIQAIVSGHFQVFLDLWSNYPKHANYAVKKAVEIVKALKEYLDNSLVIVTSDHGELLGDGGVHHGYFLKDGLLKVPLWIKYPNGFKPLIQEAPFMSLIQIPTIVRSVVYGDDIKLGGNVVYAESFGITHSKKYVESLNSWNTDWSKFFNHRVRVYARDGVLTYNIEHDLIEESAGDTKKALDSVKAFAHFYKRLQSFKRTYNH